MPMSNCHSELEWEDILICVNETKGSGGLRE